MVAHLTSEHLVENENREKAGLTVVAHPVVNVIYTQFTYILRVVAHPVVNVIYILRVVAHPIDRHLQGLGCIGCYFGGVCDEQSLKKSLFFHFLHGPTS